MANETKTQAEVDLGIKDAPIAQPIARVEAEPRQILGVEQIDVDYEQLLRKFEQRARFVEGVRRTAIAQTKPHHWLGRKAGGGESIYNLQGPGAELIRTVCPIGFENVQQREEKWSKESGPGYTIWFEASVYLGDKRAGLLPVLGSCSSDDDFFSTEHVRLPYNPDNPEHQELLASGEARIFKDGEKQTLYVQRRIPASEVTRENIVKSALTNLVVNGVTRVLGIRSMSAEQLKGAGVDIEKTVVAEYGSARKESGKLAPAMEEKRTQIWRMLLEMAGGDEAAAKAALKKRTAFNDFQGFDDPAKLSEKQIGYHFDKIKADHARHTGDATPAAASKSSKPAPQQRQPGEEG